MAAMKCAVLGLKSLKSALHFIIYHDVSALLQFQRVLTMFVQMIIHARAILVYVVVFKCWFVL